MVFLRVGKIDLLSVRCLRVSSGVLFRGEYPSGQRGQTVNLVAQPSQVRILLPPIIEGSGDSAFIAVSRRFLRGVAGVV